MPSGSMAVDLFFVMSGFVIAHAYDKRIPTLGVCGFIRLRAIRFYPLYLLGVGIGVFRQLILLGIGSQELSLVGIAVSLIAALVFLPAPPLSPVGDEISPLDGPAWSLILEMWINAAYALFFRFLTTPALVGVIILGGFTLAIGAFAGEVGGGFHWGDLPLGVARVCYSFPLGILIYRHRRKINVSPKMGKLTLFITILCFMVPISPYYNLIYILILSPCILIGIFAAPFPAPLASYCGTSSYCIYAIHMPLLILTAGIAHRLGFSGSWMVWFLIIILLLLTPILDRFYDRPFRKALSLTT